MNTYQAELMAIFEAELEAFEEFLGILQIEAETLQSRSVDALPELTQLKSEQVAHLSQLALERSHLLKNQGFSPDAYGMSHWLYYYDFPEKTLTNYWRTIVELARQAHDLNQKNGALIELKLMYNQQALNILQSAATQLSVYDKGGQAHSTSLGKRELGKA